MKTEYRMQAKGVICMRIGLVTAGVVLSALCLGQASRPKAADAGEKGVVRESKPAAATTTRSSTGRPADLDPRIPWLEDLGMPQSGGPEPLVPVRGTPLRGISTITSVAEANGSLVIMENEWILRCLDEDGTTRWSKMLPGPGRWRVLVSESHILAVPLVVTKEGQSRIHIYGISGDEVGDIPWGLRPKLDYLDDVKVERGVIVGDTHRGRRIHARIDPRSTIDPDSIVTEGDVDLMSNLPEEERGKHWGRGKAVIGIKPVKLPRDAGREKVVNETRSRRAKPLIGKTFEISGLPYYQSGAGKLVAPWLAFTLLDGIRMIGLDGSMIAVFDIFNPHGLARAHCITLLRVSIAQARCTNPA